MLLAVRRQLVHSRHRIATIAPSSSKSPTCLFKTRGRNLGTSSSNGNGHNGGQVPAVTPTAMCKAGGIGVVAGVFGSLVGMGGAFVLIPALTGLLKFSQHQAHALYVAGLGMMTARMGAVVSGRLSAATLQRLC
ncbi:hypothetical protein NGA_0076700, partial [Nannochloropsis gaditana CCMP526]|uniref:uncharacterized protein n=1 Tax=Nannochloropsis gaditana (strain CCMP526) TaxID=1093141 RepID=UPI00029F6DB9